MGGDEFDEFVVLTKDRDYKNAEALILQLKDSVKGSGGEVSYEKVSAAVGYAVYKPGDCGFMDVFNRADGDMYKYKEMMHKGML